MRLSPDEWIIWEYGAFQLSATLVYTWLVMGMLIGLSWLATRRVRDSLVPGRWQGALEAIIVSVRDQIREIAPGQGDRYLPFIATLFLFILVSNLIGVIPGLVSPTGSVSTATALAIAVFIAVPVFGIGKSGLGAFAHRYIRPTVLMLPFNLIGELSRTFALAVRLYGNVMSGAVLAAILLSVVPLFFPVLMQSLSLLTGVIQAYIFAVLATVYIASASPREAYTTQERTHG